MTAEQHRRQAEMLLKRGSEQNDALALHHQQIAALIDKRNGDGEAAEDAWNEADHPRGQPGNAGQFGSGGGGGAQKELDLRKPEQPAEPAPSRGRYAGQYVTTGGTPKKNHLLTVSRVLSTPVNRGIHYRRMLAQLIREAPQFGSQSALPSLRRKLSEALLATQAQLRQAGRTAEADRAMQQALRIQPPPAPPPAPRPARPERPPAPGLRRPQPPAPAPAPPSPKQAAQEEQRRKLVNKYQASSAATETYAANVDIDPDDFAKALVGPVPMKNPQIGSTPDGGMTFTAELGGPGAGYGRIRRYFDFKRGTVDHAFLVIPNNQRKAGKAILAGQMALYQKLGMKQVEVHANIDVGSYAWAKYGFLPAQSSWDTLRTNLKARLDDIAAPHERGTTLKETYELLGQRNPKALWDLVDHPAAINGKSVAKMLLTGDSAPDWYGSLSLSDKDQMNRFQSYVSKEA
jgi:hypothetical protein